VAWSLRSYDEVRDPADLFDDIPAKKADPSIIAIARKIIEQQDGPFEPSDFKDRYEEALRELIRRKEKGGKTKVAAALPEVEAVWFVDLNPHNRAFVSARAEELGLGARLRCFRDLEDRALPAHRAASGPGPFQALARFQRIDDHSENPISAAPPSPVSTSGIWTIAWAYMITDRIRIA
jgi:hypothetical protein